MPSIIPGYVYTLFAALVVGAIIVVGCTMATLNVRTQAVNQQLSNVEQYVAAQSLALVSHVTEDNQNITQVLNLPAQVGNQVYWVSLGSDTTGVDVTGGLGSTEVIGSQPGVSIPAQIAASGTYSSTSGRALLQCSVENQTVTLTLTEID
jgi:hypothetical protein